MAALANALRAAGIQVPADLPVVGYDDVELARHLHPSLSTIHQSIDQAGIAMVDALRRIIAGEHVEPIQLPTELVVRESSRQPAWRPARAARSPRRSSAR